MLRKLYDWTMAKAAHPKAEWWLGGFAFVEASFFPIPPHPLLGLMCLAEPNKAIRFGLIATFASVAGGLFGYAIGYFLYETIGAWLLGVLGLTGSFPQAACYLHVSDADTFHSALPDGLEVGPIEDQPWGMREFTIEEANGHRLRLAQHARQPEPSTTPREPLAGVRIVKRLPTTGEYHTLVQAVRWTEFINHEAAARSLARSLFCVVAELEGRCIAMARVVAAVVGGPWVSPWEG